MATSMGDPGLSIRRPAGQPGRKRKERVVRGVLITAAGVSLVVSVAIVLALIGQTGTSSPRST